MSSSSLAPLLYDPPPSDPIMPLPRLWHAAPKQPPISPMRRKLLIRSYAPDWIITIVLAAVFFSLNEVHGFRREFSLNDRSLLYPFAVHERVPDVALYMIAIVAPLVIMPFVNFFSIRSWWDLHHGTLGLILGLSLTGALTQVVKITVGRPRPDLIDRCQPPSGSIDPVFGLSNSSICTNTDFSIMEDGFRSFFSGHSSLSFAGLGFLAYYLAGKLHLFDKRGTAAKAWISLTPFIGAALVAISRTMDSRHHWQDVLVGSIVGTFFSFFAYRQYYPPLSSPLSHRPYSPRIPREVDSALLPSHHTADNSLNAAYPFLGQNKPVAHSAPAAAGSLRYNNFSGPSANNGANGHSRGGSLEDYELDGTVLHPGPGPLTEVWKDGEDGAAENAVRNGELEQHAGVTAASVRRDF